MTTPRLSDLLLERLLLGELPAAEQAALEARLATDPDAKARLAALRADDAAILARYPASEMARQIDARVRVAEARKSEPGRRHTGRTAMMLGLPAFAAAAVAMLAVVDHERASVAPEIWDLHGTGEVTRSKGPTQLVIVRKSGEREERLERSQASAQAGDRLQLAYRADQGFGVIVSIDGRGHVTQHLPESGVAAVALATPTLIPLSHAYELDDAPRFETFFLVASDQAFDARVALDAARALARDGDASQDSARLPLPQGFTQTVFAVHKLERGP